MLRDGKRNGGSRALVRIGDLGSSWSVIPLFPDPFALSPTELFSDHWPLFGEELQVNEQSDVNMNECPVDHPSRLMQSEIVTGKVCTFPGHPVLEEDSAPSSALITMRPRNQEVVVVATLCDYSVRRSSFSEQVLPPHIGMVSSYQAFIQDLGTESDKASMSRLIRYALLVRGVKMLDIRYKLHHWYRDWVDKHGAVAVQTQKDFAFQLIESEWYEDKLAAVLFIQEVLIAKKMISFMDLPRLEGIFRGGHIKVHKVCDHFSRKILCHLVQQSTRSPCQKAWMVNALLDWTHAEDLWQARAAMFALADQAKNGIRLDLLMHSVEHMLSRVEEDAKNVAGAVLRSISDVDRGTVVQFLNRSENLAKISTCGLDKATSRLTKREREGFKNLRRDLCSESND